MLGKAKEDAAVLLLSASSSENRQHFGSTVGHKGVREWAHYRYTTYDLCTNFGLDCPIISATNLGFVCVELAIRTGNLSLRAAPAFGCRVPLLH